IEGNPEGFLNFAKVMASNASEGVSRAAHEILTIQKEAPKEFGGIVSELYKYLAFLNDPMLLRSLEEPDFSLAALSDPAQRCNVYLNVPPEYIGIWNPFLRLCFGVAMLYKQRRPDAPGVLFLIDEAGQMGRFEMLQRAFTFGRGMGVRAWAVFQDLGQISHHYGQAGVQTFLGSAQVRQFFGVRDHQTALLVSNMLGDQTLSYIEPRAREDALHAQREAMRGLLRGSVDPFDALREAGHYKRLAETPEKQHRRLLAAEEVLSMPEDRQVLFISGVGCPPIAAWRHPYFERREMAGLFLPNPYHPPLDRVRLRGRLGRRWAKVTTAPVPSKFARYPQYADGRSFQYVKGFKP
ncbi:MAG: type IV secretory system conjugative DNA transfer family protein, partial [Proteobacteria bacterium]|nr:type IV secretory system conjugative DNA transfer family protein [Pseudomonadota bacterium]